MKFALAGLLLTMGALLGCTNRTSVGKNETYCPGGDADCPDSQPRCETELRVCFQCVDRNDCGGVEPQCDAGVCVCEADGDCPGALICVDERCTED